MTFPTLFTNGVFPAKGGMREISNNASLGVTTGKILIECPVCGLHVLKPAAWVRRRTNSFCGRACADEFRRIRVKAPCAVCGTPFFTTPSLLSRVVCCSAECSSRKKSEHLLSAPIFSGYVPVALTRATGNKLAKLSVAQAEEIAASAERTGILAKRYGVSTVTIQGIRRKAREA